MFLVEDSAPPAGALPLAELRAHLRLGSGFALAEDPAEDAALLGYLRAAIATIEARTGKVLLERRFRLRLDDWRDPEGQTLPLAPVHRVEKIEVESRVGEMRIIAPHLYRLVPDGQRPRIDPTGSFLPALPDGGSVTIHFDAGFGGQWSDVPADLAQGVLLLAARYYEDRSFEGSMAAIPQGVAALIERWRLVRVLGGRGAAHRRRGGRI